MIASSPASLFYRFFSVYMTGFREVTVSSDTMRELGMICQGEMPEKTIVQVKPETTNHKNTNQNSENMNKKDDFEGENIEKNYKNMRFSPFYGHTLGFIQPFIYFYHFRPLPSRFFKNIRFQTFYGGEPTHHPDHVQCVHSVPATWSTEKVRETQSCTFLDGACKKFFKGKNRAKNGCRHKNLSNSSHNHFNLTDLHFIIFIHNTSICPLIIIESNRNLKKTDNQVQNQVQNLTIRPISAPPNSLGKFSSDFQHFPKQFPILTYFDNFFSDFFSFFTSFFHIFPHNFTFPTSYQPISIFLLFFKLFRTFHSFNTFLPTFSHFFCFSVNHHRLPLTATTTRNTNPTKKPTTAATTTTDNQHKSAATRGKFLGKFSKLFQQIFFLIFTFFSNFSTFFPIFFPHFFSPIFNILFIFLANQLLPTATTTRNTNPTKKPTTAATTTAATTTTDNRHKSAATRGKFLGKFSKLFQQIFFLIFTFFQTFQHFFQLFSPTFSHLFSTFFLSFLANQLLPTNNTTPTQQLPSTTPTNHTTTNQTSTKMDQASAPKKSRYTELLSSAQEDPTLNKDTGAITELYLRGYHKPEFVRLNLTVRHSIDPTMIISIGPTTIAGDPAVEIYLRSNGIGVSLLKGAKFHDGSVRTFLSIEDLAAPEQSREEIAIMMYKVPFKLSTSKKALLDVLAHAIPDLKFKDATKIEAVNDDSGAFASKVRVCYDKNEIKELIDANGAKDERNWKQTNVGVVLVNSGRVVIADFTNNVNNRNKPFYQIEVKMMTDEYVFKRELHQEDNTRTIGVLPAKKSTSRRKCIKCYIVKKVEVYCERKLCITICPRCSGRCENEGHCAKNQRSQKKRSGAGVADQAEKWRKQWEEQALNADTYCYIRKTCLYFVVIFLCLNFFQILLSKPRGLHHLQFSTHQILTKTNTTSHQKSPTHHQPLNRHNRNHSLSPSSNQFLQDVCGSMISRASANSCPNRLAGLLKGRTSMAHMKLKFHQKNQKISKKIKICLFNHFLSLRNSGHAFTHRAGLIRCCS